MYSTNENNENISKSEIKPLKQVKEKTFKEMQSEMLEEIYNYSLELRDSNFKMKYPRLAHFKKSLYPALDNLVKQCNIISDEKLRANKMRIIYVWFCQKKTSYFNLLNIYKSTAKKDYDKSEEPIEIKNKPYEAGNFKEEFEKEHRSDIPSIDPAKTR